MGYPVKVAKFLAFRVFVADVDPDGRRVAVRCRQIGKVPGLIAIVATVSRQLAGHP